MESYTSGLKSWNLVLVFSLYRKIICSTVPTHLQPESVGNMGLVMTKRRLIFSKLVSFFDMTPNICVWGERAQRRAFNFSKKLIHLITEES